MPIKKATARTKPSHAKPHRRSSTPEAASKGWEKVFGLFDDIIRVINQNILGESNEGILARAIARKQNESGSRSEALQLAEPLIRHVSMKILGVRRDAGRRWNYQPIRQKN